MIARVHSGIPHLCGWALLLGQAGAESMALPQAPRTSQPPHFILFILFYLHSLFPQLPILMWVLKHFYYEKLQIDTKTDKTGNPFVAYLIRIWHSHCCGSGQVPAPGTSMCLGLAKNKKHHQKKQNSLLPLLARSPQAPPLFTHGQSGFINYPPLPSISS